MKRILCLLLWVEGKINCKYQLSKVNGKGCGLSTWPFDIQAIDFCCKVVTMDLIIIAFQFLCYD